MKLSDLIFDNHNANLGTEKGTKLLESSLSKYGAGRSILIDRNNSIISGNKTIEMAGQLGFNNIKIVETTGQDIVAVKRMDLDLSTDKKARALAYADNRVSEVDLSWDISQIKIDLPELPDLKEFFSEFELDFSMDKISQESNNLQREEKELSGEILEREKVLLEKEEELSEREKVLSEKEEEIDRKGFSDLNDWCFFPSSNKWGIPNMLPKENIAIPEVLLEYREPVINDGKVKAVAFYMQDYRIRSAWSRIKDITESRIKKVGITLTPDFSPYSNYPQCLQVFNVYRNRFCGRYWQSLRIPVIPTVTWNNDPACYDFVFCGIPKGSVISFSITGGHNKTEEDWNGEKRAVEEMMNRLEPSKVLIYGESFKKWEKVLNIIPEDRIIKFESRWMKKKGKSLENT
jgi:hypothetical protein